MEMETKRRPQGERIRRAVAAQAAPTHAPLRPWHIVLFVVTLALGWLAIRAPGLLADVAAYPLADWQWFGRVRWAVIILATYALVFVRAYHPVVGLGMAATILGLGVRIGLGQITEEPLTVGHALLLLALVTLPVRVITRPNDAELIRQLRERLGEGDA